MNGLICLANYVTQNLPSVRVELLNLSTTRAELITETIGALFPQERGERLVVGITTLTAFYQSSLQVARTFKYFSPDCTVVFGGHHASADAEIVLRNHPDTVDFVVVGEGEKSLVEFLEKVGTAAVYDTPGLAFLRGDDFHRTPPPVPRPGGVGRHTHHLW